MDTSIEMLYDLIGKIWDTDEIPIGWKEGYLEKIPKNKNAGTTEELCCYQCLEKSSTESYWKD